MQIISYELLGFCFYFPEQLKKEKDAWKLKIESCVPLYYELIHCTIFRLKTVNINR